MTCNSIGSLAMERLDDWRRDVDQRVPAWPKSKIASEPPTAPNPISGSSMTVVLLMAANRV